MKISAGARQKYSHLKIRQNRIFLARGVPKGLVFFFPGKDGVFLHLALKIPMGGFWTCFFFRHWKKNKFFEKKFRSAPQLWNGKYCVFYIQSNKFLYWCLLFVRHQKKLLQNSLDRFTLLHDKEMAHGCSLYLEGPGVTLWVVSL